MRVSAFASVRRRFAVVIVLTLIAVVTLLVTDEMRTFAYQARFFAELARPATFRVGPGQSNAIRFPDSGPYDKRLGYADLPVFLDKLQAQAFEITHQARMSESMTGLSDRGFFVPYREKAQAGLTVLGDGRRPLFRARYPQRVYARYEDVPPILVQTLLFIENRELLDTQHPHRNPAVEWDRLARAMAARAITFNAELRTPGGSTLATQIEKYRHSPEGRTTSTTEKMRQMVSASLRAYQQGEDTSNARRQIVMDYLNTVPLSAKSGHGEINGLGDALWAWYGCDFGEVNRMLAAVSEHLDGHAGDRAANHSGSAGGSGDCASAVDIYKWALSLLISQRRPSYYLGAREGELEQLTNSYLRLLAGAGVIPSALSDAAQKVALNWASIGNNSPRTPVVTDKTATTVRTHLAAMLGSSRLYDLDRFDLEVASTLNIDMQNAVTAALRALRDPANARAAGLYDKNLLDRGDPAKVVYSFTLYERGEQANYLRVQTDSLDQPFDVNIGSKLDLGSTAKLRTLVTYLEVVADLHQRYGRLDQTQLRAVVIEPRDRIGRWAIDYLASRKDADASLRSMLEAALERRYSASPHEQFFTGGGMHTFTNFSREDNGRTMSVREAMRNSVNLVFIRLIRDVVHHHTFGPDKSSAPLLRDADDARRKEYLMRFADREGRVFTRRFYRKYQGRTPEEFEALLLKGMRPTPTRLASVFHSIAPDARPESFAAFLEKNLPSNGLSASRVAKLYEQYAPQKMSLGDRGYVAGVHPLELWVVAFLRAHPDATLTQVIEASADERQAVYSWLFSTNRKQAQDTRIRSQLELEGFRQLHRRWKRLGYPFDSLVPSYATALGASADRPAALAELMGIIVNDGMRKPGVLIESLHFAAGTPYETMMQRSSGKSEQVMPREVAQALRAVLREVVTDGTAKRVRGAFARANASVIPLGGKTGTGDHRFDVYGRNGQLLESRVVNRSATFVFHIGDHFFGTITAYVRGSKAADYGFTSALPVQLLKVLAPRLMPLVAVPETLPDGPVKKDSQTAMPPGSVKEITSEPQPQQ